MAKYRGAYKGGVSTKALKRASAASKRGSHGSGLWGESPGQSRAKRARSLKTTAKRNRKARGLFS